MTHTVHLVKAAIIDLTKAAGTLHSISRVMRWLHLNEALQYSYGEVISANFVVKREEPDNTFFDAAHAMVLDIYNVDGNDELLYVVKKHGSCKPSPLYPTLAGFDKPMPCWPGRRHGIATCHAAHVR